MSDDIDTDEIRAIVKDLDFRIETLKYFDALATLCNAYDAQRDKIKRLREVLEKLAKLGNGDRYGNSIGNEIARKALEEK